MSGPAMIVGALGQDGRLLADRLLAAAVDVVGVVRPGSAIGAKAPYRLVDLDLADTDAVSALIERERPGQIFYLAAVHHSAEAMPADRLALWPAMARTNCLGVVNMIRAVLKHQRGCQLIFAASSQMYSTAEGDLRVDEATPCQPRTFYGETKAWSMEAVRFARAQEGLPGGTAILFNHESPLRNPSFISRKITRAAAAIRLGREKRMHAAPAVYADTTLIETELAWKPTHDFETWIRAMVDADLAALRHAAA
jgi:GDPmannose 4,6-dehydratase